ncbi:MAG: BBP7 family outer membrane beta-barrel protein [Planctomycetes bacterium]|nr:BBP7 family outer membrane beta-barrel protein [Planctomycetota bacterium]
MLDEPGTIEPVDPWCDEYMANGPDALVYSSGEWMNDGCWFSSADVVLMHRANPKSRVLDLDTTLAAFDGLSPASSMTTARNGFHIAPGGRATIGRFLGRDWANRDQSVEFTFLGLFDWQKTDGIESSFPQRLYTPFDPGFVFDPAIPLRNAVYGGFAAADVAQYEYTTSLNSFELNLRTRYRLERDCMTAMPDGTWTRQITPGPTPSLLAGLRYLRINETFDWHSERFNNPALGQANLGNATGDYDIQTSNDLFGFQVGADWTRQEKDWRMGAWIKAGGLVNFSHQKSVVVTADNFFTDISSTREASDQVFTFAGEAGLSGAYHFNPNVSLRGGLELLWIQSVAVAPEQISFNFAAPPEVDLSGNVFYMGASVGLEVIW